MKKSLLFLLFLLSGIGAISQTLFKGSILDENTGEPIENAKLGVSEQGVGVLSNDKGYFSYRKYDKVLDRNSKLLVSARGYKTLTLDINQMREIYDTSAKIALSKGEDVPSTKENAIHVFWDVSEGMLGRDEEKELHFLENYLKQKGPTTVNFAVFNDKVIFWRSLKIVNGDISRFRESIKNIGNIGPADYSLVQMEGAQEVLLFSNGNNSLGYLDVKQDVPVIIATTRVKYRDEAKLNQVASYTSGKYLALDKEYHTQEVQSTRVEENEALLIKGFVSSEGQALAGAKIQLKGIFDEFTTDKNGQFTVPASLDDILICSYIGMFTREVLVNDDQLTIDLIPKNNVLDEVVITTRSENFVVNNKVIKGEQIDGAPGGITGRGYAYITAKDIKVQGKDIIEVLKESFSSVRLTNDAFNNAGITVAGNKYSFFINGARYLGVEFPYYIKDKDINSIIIKDDPDELGIKYGILDPPGYWIIVTTKQDTQLQEKYRYTALAKGNDYKETVGQYYDAFISGTSVRGAIKSLDNPIEGASILLKGSSTEVFSKNDGSFAVEASPGDELIVNYLGMFSKTVKVPVSMELDINLIPKNNVLDEVVLTGSKEEFIVSGKKMTGNTHPSIPGGFTALGDFYITAKNIVPNGRTLPQVVRDKFKAVILMHTPEGEVLLVRGNTPQYVVDGFLLGPGEPPPFYLFDNEIESIIVKESRNLTSRYSITPVSGLAIIVTTKKGAGTNKIPNALAKNNIYKEEVAPAQDMLVSIRDNFITGNVTSLGKPLQGVKITNKSTFYEAKTNAQGDFEIEANQGDLVFFNFLNMYPKMLKAEEGMLVNIELLPKNDVLDEVVVAGNSREETAGIGQSWVHKNLELSSGNIVSIPKVEIENYPNLAFALNGKRAGVSASWSPTNGLLVAARDGAMPIAIDNMLFEPNEYVDIDPSIVYRVDIIKSIGIPTPFGPTTHLGMAIITTINHPDIIESRKKKNPFLKNNIYQEQIVEDNNTIISKAQPLISGTITSLDKPLQGVTLSKTGSFEEYKTDAHGRYKIPAQEGDVFIAQYLGMYPKSFEITDQKEYKVDMVPKNEVLGEVSLQGERRQERTISTPFGKKNYDAVGYDIEVMTQEDIGTKYPDIKTALIGKFPGIKVDSRYNIAVKGVRASTYNYDRNFMLLVVDNQIINLNDNPNPADDTQTLFTDPTPFISPDRVKKITIIKSLAGTARYGSIGRNGVVEIETTDYGSVNIAEQKSPLIIGNDYEDDTGIGQFSSKARTTNSGTRDSKVQGVVWSEGEVLQGASIALKGTFDQVYTNDKGAFVINGTDGDVLVVSYLGKFTKQVRVDSGMYNYNINLIASNNSLDEIVVRGTQRVDNTIQTAYGKEVENKIGYTAAEIKEETFSTGATSLRDLITGKIPGVTIKHNDYEGTSYRMRSTGSINDDISPIWIVNGVPHEEEPTFLDVQRIASISALKGLKAVNKYGTIARGGAFVITTKDYVFDENDISKPQSGLISGNNYQEENNTTSAQENEVYYITRLREISNASDQFSAYQQMARTQELSLEFYSDVVRYFQKNNLENADRARADLAYIARNNTKALRTLAYLYEEAEDYQKMLQTYERVLAIAPQESQSYRDVAHALVVNTDYNKALEMYRNMLGERVKGVNFTGIEPVLKTELSRLVQLHKDKIEFDRLPNEWLRADFKKDVRMVIEWTDASVPFEFQFVNPDKKFFKWMHTLEDNRTRLIQELKEGFQMEEFIIDDAPEGEWIVNVQYLGEDSDYVLPPFLKYTIYRNYGTAEETKQSRILKIFKQSQKVTLGKIEI